MAFVVNEQEFATAQLELGNTPLVPEILVPRIGEYMIQQGYIQPDELQAALVFQEKMSQSNRPVLLGQALLELDLIDRETLDQVITYQILRLQTALADANRNLTRRVEERTIELQRALTRLSELNQLKSHFLANISHELRTPLTHMRGYLDLLSEEELGPLTASQSKALKVLKNAEKRLTSLIEDLIQFSISSKGELSLNLKETSIRRLILSNIEKSTYKAEAKEIELIVELTEDLPDVRIDEDKIGWVIHQLMDNAIKFTAREGRVVISAQEQKGLVTVTVKDTGIGIPPDRTDEIFEAFHQLDGASTRKYAGTGLGLAMARKIIEAHGSQIKVVSEIGRSSSFYFSIPALGEDSK